MGKLTTHVLDTSAGKPAAGLRVELFRRGVDGAPRVAEAVTNADGRCERPLLEGASFRAGVYELLFHAGEYLDAIDAETPSPKFLDVIPIRFGISEETAHYHVPLLLSPYGYSTYRGS